MKFHVWFVWLASSAPHVVPWLLGGASRFSPTCLASIARASKQRRQKLALFVHLCVCGVTFAVLMIATILTVARFWQTLHDFSLGGRPRFLFSDTTTRSPNFAKSTSRPCSLRSRPLRFASWTGIFFLIPTLESNVYACVSSLSRLARMTL